jgi:histone H2A
MQNKRQRITPRHVKLAIAYDSEINKLLKHVTIAGGGVLPHIESALLPKQNDKKADKKVKSSKDEPKPKV